MKHLKYIRNTLKWTETEWNKWNRPIAVLTHGQFHSFHLLQNRMKQIKHLGQCLLRNRVKRNVTRGPWWSYIAHLSKQLSTLTVEVSAKFTALRFLYKFYSLAPQWPCFFSCIMMAWTDSWKRITNNSAILKSVQWFLTKRFLKCFILAMFFDKSWLLEQTW